MRESEESMREKPGERRSEHESLSAGSSDMLSAHMLSSHTTNPSEHESR